MKLKCIDNDYFSDDGNAEVGGSRWAGGEATVVDGGHAAYFKVG